MKKQFFLVIIHIYFISTSLFAAIPVDFSLLKLVYPRKSFNSLQVKASTMIFNNENPENNLLFEETLLIKDFKNFLSSISVDKKNAANINLKRIVKFNLLQNRYFVEGDYLTLKINYPVAPLIYLLFSNKNDYLKQILLESKIDTDIIGMGRLNNGVHRIYGAKELNTHRKDSPPILLGRRNDLLEERSQYKKIKPQIWINKDTFYLTRFITHEEKDGNIVVNDINFKNYKVFDDSKMFPSTIEIYRNGRLYSTTNISEIKVNPILKKSIFSLNSKFKKRTFSKMLENFSSDAKQIIDFIQSYR